MGGQKGVAHFYHYLSNHCSVVLALSKENEIEKTYPFQLHPFLFNHWVGFLNIIYIPSLIKLIKQEKIDIIILEHSYFGWLGFLLRYFTGKPFIIHSHNLEFERFKMAGRKWWKMYAAYEKWVHKKANHIFYKCEEDAAAFLQLLPATHPSYSIITYGTHLEKAPTHQEQLAARKWIEQYHNISTNHLIFLLNGTMNYAPNKNAANIIIEQIIPLLQKEKLAYTIIFCGSGFTESFMQLADNIPEIIIAGYVPDIDMYLKGCTAFIQPSALATGIKTKLVEALANNLTVITTESGARGLQNNYLTNKMSIVEDNNIEKFIHQMKSVALDDSHSINTLFFENFYWNNIAHKAYLSLLQLL